MQKTSLSNILLRLEKLEKFIYEKETGAKRSKSKVNQFIGNVNIDFSLPIRPFIKKYCIDMGGPKKFTLLLAYLVNGDQDKICSLASIHKEWNKLKGFLSEFNRSYTTKAKDKDWVDTKKDGYFLRPEWKKIFNK